MKTFAWIFQFKLSAIIIFCPAMVSLIAVGQIDDAPVTGHFTHKGKPETLILITPKLNSTETGCYGGCLTKIKFSDPAEPVISIKDCIGGTLTNLGDLNGDGLDEIGLLPDWFAGCWRSYKVFTFKHHQWELAVDPFPTHCNQWETDGVKPIIKDPAKPGNVLISYSAFEGNDIVIKTKSVPIK
jgi:hypothetical protein